MLVTAEVLFHGAVAIGDCYTSPRELGARVVFARISRNAMLALGGNDNTTFERGLGGAYSGAGPCNYMLNYLLETARPESSRHFFIGVLCLRYVVLSQGIAHQWVGV